MSAVTVTSTSSFAASTNNTTKESLGLTLVGCLDGIERHAERIGAELDWSTFQIESETETVDISTLLGPQVEERITMLRLSAMGVMA